LLQVDKTCPDLKGDANDILAFNKFMDELMDPPVVLAMGQLQPETVSEAVQVTV